ncbi:MAG: protein kinase [Deltaproteobacteria bacterium]|nr:protein kinase [Deltaproteobacteria bacterium]
MKVGPYDVLRKLGEGAFGKVYLARRGDSSGFVTYYALKRIARNRDRGDEFEEYLRREARVGGLVNHPSLVRIHEVITLRSEWVLVQDYVDGVTLSSVLADHRSREVPIPREAALELVAALLESLDYLHTLRDPEGRKSGFVHRDVKPGNVMLTEGHGIRVMDFGVARGDEAGVGTLAGELRGTIAYMAPEQATGGAVGPASDQFAAGLMLVEMLSGGSPWGNIRGAAVLGKVVTGDVSHGLSAIEDEDLQPILLRLLAREPEQRFPTAGEAADALRAVRAKVPTPPALRRFCIGVVHELRTAKLLEETDDHPSWTGRWAPAGEQEGHSLGPGGLSLVGAEAVGPLSEPVSAPLDDPPAAADSQPGPEAADVAEPGVHAPEPAPAPEPEEEEMLDLDEDPSPPAEGGSEADAVAAASPGLHAVIDESSTLPLEATPAQRLALLAALGAAAPSEPLRVGTGETLEEAQARLGDVDPEQTLPIPLGAARASGGLPTPPADAGRAPGEPSQAGAHPVPRSSGPPGVKTPLVPFKAAPAEPATKRRKRKKSARTQVKASVGTQLWQQFLKSPLLGTLILLGALLLIAATARLAWMAVVPGGEPEVVEDAEDDLMLPSQRLAARQKGLAPPPPKVAPRPTADDEQSDVAPRGAEPDEAVAAPSIIGDPDRPGEGDGLAAAADDAAPVASVFDDGPRGVDPERSERRVASVEPARAPRPEAGTTGEDLDADLASWRGEKEEPTPAPRRPAEGQIISGSGAGDRLLEEADGERSVATRRGDGSDEPQEKPAAAATGPVLRFLSSNEQPVGAPLSVRVRSDGFYATSVVVYYQWRSEGSAARKRRSLRQQGDGSFALEIPASELRADRLQLWFSADPGGVLLGDASHPVEVRVR